MSSLDIDRLVERLRCRDDTPHKEPKLAFDLDFLGECLGEGEAGVAGTSVDLFLERSSMLRIDRRSVMASECEVALRQYLQAAA
jgi:hypothetical protein